MAEMIKLQVTERVKRTGDKENDINDLVDQGTVGLTGYYRHVTAIRYYIMVIYHHLLFSVILCQYCDDY